MSEASLAAKVGAIVQQMLGVPVDVQQPLMEAGLDSLGAVELRTSLNAAFGVELPVTVTFDHPSVAALAKFLASQDAPVIIQVWHCISTAYQMYPRLDLFINVRHVNQLPRNYQCNGAAHQRCLLVPRTPRPTSEGWW